MTKIFKALMETAETQIGKIHTAELERKEPEKSYTSDEITVNGFMEDGRPYRLHLKVGDAP